MNLPIPLAEVFTAPGIITWAAAMAGIVEVLKRAIPFIPSTGRGVLYVVMILSAALVGLAAWDAGTQLDAASIVGLVLTWVALITASAGTYEVAAKGGRIVQGTTNPTGPDVTGPVSG